MTNAELIACIQAEEQGKRIECRKLGTTDWKSGMHLPGRWNTETSEYRIAREPRKCWVHWGSGKNPIVQAYGNTPATDEAYISDGWQLVVEEIR